MESEEQNNTVSTTTVEAAVPPPPALSAPVTLPPYPLLIMEAIDALGDKNGSNKSTISKQIESTYGTLPAAHTTLLTHHLNKMKQMGQLALVKNNYMRPDPNAPPRRGRGRPPKPKPALPAGYIPPPPRPRGRPPKARDPLAPPPPPKMKSGRKRGRPPKSVKASSTSVAAVPVQVPVAKPLGERRGRGRPPKVKPAVAAPVGA